MMFPLSLLLLLFSYYTHARLLGWVESPGYPSGYLPHASLNWTRCAPKGHIVSIRLLHLDLEDSQDCENDAVKVFSNGSLIAVLCGKKEFEELQLSINPLLLSTPGGCLSLSFHSDFSNTKKHIGFRGFYSDQDFDECQDDLDNGCTQFCHNFIGGYHCSCRHGYRLDRDKHTCRVSCGKDLSGLTRGDISSPSWPKSYAENSNCVYTLSVEEVLQLELHFNDVFDVEQSSDDECIDSLRIETHSGTLGPFCGRTPPPSPLLTHSHHVQIHFITDSFGDNKGFSLHFQTREKVCLHVTPHSSASPQQPEYSAGQTVTVSCDLGYVVNTPGTQTLLTQYETTCKKTGVWNPTYRCEPVDCGLPNIAENDILQLTGSDEIRSLYNSQIRFICSSKYYKLRGEDTYTCGASGEWQSSGGETELPKCVEDCGMPETQVSNVGRIMGGKDAEPGEIPWHLLIKEPYRGGASLISDRWAVTAAHVVENVPASSLQMYGGLVNREAMLNKFSNTAKVNVSQIIIHPGYLQGISDRTNFDNDIALIRFASRVTLGPNLLPICLPEINRGVSEGELGTVSGWGMADGSQRRFYLSSTLKYADIGVYSLSRCRDTPRTESNKPAVFTANMFCAGAPGRDSCQKDSGGPFVVPVLGEEGPHYLAGIVSWGPPCFKKQFKGYYTKVENYVDWIRKTMAAVDKAERGEENI